MKITTPQLIFFSQSLGLFLVSLHIHFLTHTLRYTAPTYSQTDSCRPVFLSLAHMSEPLLLRLCP